MLDTNATRRAFLGFLAAHLAVPNAALARDILRLNASEMRTHPDLRIRLGEDFRLQLANDLDAPLALHWRGLRLPNDMDGVPGLTGNAIAPGDRVDIGFTPPDAGTFLYHPSLRSHAAMQMARGFVGLFIVEEKQPPQTDADLAILLSESTDEKGERIILANGRRQLETMALPPQARIRLRIGNGSSRRMMAIGIDGAIAQVAAIDGQPCGLFEPARQTLPLVPGSRYDLFFDLPNHADANVSFVLRGAGEATQTILRWRTHGKARALLEPFAGLPANPKLPVRIALEKSRRAELVIDQAPDGRSWRLNEQVADEIGPKQFLSIPRGTPVMLNLVNRSKLAQIIHVHGHALRHIHALDDGWEPYWRDSVVVPAERNLRIAFVADNPGKWLIAGGFGVGEGPLGWFEVN